MKILTSFIQPENLKRLIIFCLLAIVIVSCGSQTETLTPTGISSSPGSSTDLDLISPAVTTSLTQPLQKYGENTVLSEETSDVIPSPFSTLSAEPPGNNQSELPVNTANIIISPTITRISSRTPFPTLTRRPTRTPSITPTPQPPLAYFQINNLGSYSKVISPVIPEAIVSPGQNGLIYVELFGEDDRLINKEVINYYNYIGQHFGIAPEIAFEIEAVAETGRLVISSFDRYNRMMWLTSVDLILLQIGQNQITPPKDFTEPYIIRLPEEGETIQGGMLQVRGVARILNSNPLLFDCIDEEGNLITSGEVTIHASSDGLSHIPFEAYLPYQVNNATNVRLSIRQDSVTQRPGIISLSSFEITLAP